MIRLARTSSAFLFALFIAITSAGTAVADPVQVEAFVTTGPTDPPLDVFPVDTAKLYVLFKTHGVKHGDRFRGVLVADHGGHIAPENSKTEGTSILDGDTSDGGLSFTMPIGGWPAGNYHVEIYINNQLSATVRFRFENSKSPTPAQTKP